MMAQSKCSVVRTHVLNPLQQHELTFVSSGKGFVFVVAKGKGCVAIEDNSFEYAL